MQLTNYPADPAGKKMKYMSFFLNTTILHFFLNKSFFFCNKIFLVIFVFFFNKIQFFDKSPKNMYIYIYLFICKQINCLVNAQKFFLGNVLIKNIVIRFKYYIIFYESQKFFLDHFFFYK